MTFGDRLKQIREKFNLSQADVAERIKIPRTTYSGYENNGRQPDFDSLITISDFFNVSLDYLIKGKEMPENDFINTQAIMRLNEIQKELEQLQKVLNQKHNEIQSIREAIKR